MTLTVGIAFKLTDDQFASVGWTAKNVDIHHPVVNELVERLRSMPSVVDVVLDDVLLDAEEEDVADEAAASGHSLADPQSYT